MKRITLLLITCLLMISCGKNKAEQMLYDYQQENVKSLNFNLEDLEFKIHSIEKVSDITAADSMKHLKYKLATYWTKNPKETLIDTISFDYVSSVLNQSIRRQDTLVNLYQESVITAITYDDYAFELRSKRKRDNALDEKLSLEKTLLEIKNIEEKYNDYSLNADSIVSSKYSASYSLINPMLSDIKQTFNKMFYTNADQSKFIIEETIDNE